MQNLRTISMLLALILSVMLSCTSNQDETANGESDKEQTDSHSIDQADSFASIQNTWKVTKVEIVQDGQVYNAVDYVPQFAEIIGASYQFLNDGRVLITLLRGDTEYIPYLVASESIQLGIEGYGKGEINQLDHQYLVFTVPFTNTSATYYLRYSLMR